MIARSSLLSCFLISLCCNAWSLNARADDAKVFVNEMLIVEYRVGFAKLRPDQRAAQTARQIQTLPDDVKPSKRVRKDRIQILLSTKIVMDFGPTDAQAAKTDIEDFADQIVNRLKAAIALAPLAFELPNLTIPVGKQVRIGLLGRLSRKAAIKVPEGSSLKVLRTGSELLLVGSIAATTTITASFAQHSTQSVIQVLPYAAELPNAVAVDVAGTPASALVVRAAATRALQLGSMKLWNAKLEYQLETLDAVPRGQQKQFAITVKATAPNAFERTSVMSIRVRNVGALFQPEKELWYCNDPENVVAFGPLFMAELHVQKPARLLYHHVNAMRQPMVILMGVANQSDVPARILLTLGDGAPDPNPVLVGYQAADQFMQDYATESGVVLTIPPHSWLPIASRHLAPGQTMSGLGVLRLLPGGPNSLQVKANASYPGVLAPDLLAGTSSGVAWAYTAPKPTSPLFDHFKADQVHVYPNPFKIENASFEVGGRFTFIRIGEQAIASAVPEQTLSGNFGVTYTVNVNLSNPTKNPGNIEIVFVASAGYSGGLFFVNGQYVKTKLLQPQGEERICRLRLEAGEKRKVTITTIPLSGSSYPSTLAVRPIETMQLEGPY